MSGWYRLQELKRTLQKQVEHRQTAVQENNREIEELLERLEARRLARETCDGARSAAKSTEFEVYDAYLIPCAFNAERSLQLHCYGRDPLHLAGELLDAASNPEEYQGDTSNPALPSATSSQCDATKPVQTISRYIKAILTCIAHG
eukprot:2580871-Pyramimonas_sp.AAC.1